MGTPAVAVTRQQWPLQWAAANAPHLFGLAFDAPLIGVLQRWPNTIHAVDMESVIDGVMGSGTFTSACGVRRLRLWGSNGVAALWPPRLKGMPAQFSRCRDCWVATGRMRPRVNWKPAEDAG
jgi:hypothetical protein